MKPQRRKLLIAAAGVAAINYAACSNSTVSGNLVAPFIRDAGGQDAVPDQFIMSGNLVAPIEDAGPDVKDALSE
jgi:hypothetical protein